MRAALWAALAGVALVFAPSAPAPAAPVVSLHPDSLGIMSLTSDFIAASNTIVIQETWTTVPDPATGAGLIMIDGLDHDVDYLVEMTITNLTGLGWLSFSLELLDPAGQTNDSLFDAIPYPGFVPDGFTTSNDFDALSFGESTALLPSSDVWSVAALGGGFDRDFIDFADGVLADGGDAFLSFPLTDLIGLGLMLPGGDPDPAAGINQPFLLAQRAIDTVPVPEPHALAVLAFGLAGLAWVRRRPRRLAS